MGTNGEKRLELIRKILDQSPRLAEWYGVKAEDFSVENVVSYDEKGLGIVSDAIIVDGLFDGLVEASETEGAFVKFDDMSVFNLD